MTLYEGGKGAQYVIRELNLEEELSRRLQALGLVEGTVVRLQNRKNSGALIIYVRGTRLALGKHITSGISVTKAAVLEEAVKDE